MPDEAERLTPRECRRRAAEAAEHEEHAASLAWSMLAISGDLVELRRELRSGRR